MENAQETSSDSLAEAVLRFQEHARRVVSPFQLELLKVIYGVEGAENE